MTDREKLIELLMDKPFGRATEEEETAHIEDVADYLITSGVVVREKGEWMPQILLGQMVWDCSNCKTLGSPNWICCPVCGADMRKGENG